MADPKRKALLFLGCDTNITASLLEKLCRWRDSCLNLIVVGTRRPRHTMFQNLLKRRPPPTIIPLEFDISNEESYDPFASQFFEVLRQNGYSKISGIVLCCNRLFPRWSEPLGIDPTLMMRHFLAITVRPVLLIQTFLPYLLRDDTPSHSLDTSGDYSFDNMDLRGRASVGGYTFDGYMHEAFEGREAKTVIINLTTMVSSITETQKVDHLSYQCSKCSQNMAIKALASELKENDILIYSLAMDNSALFAKPSRKVEFATFASVYEENESGEVEVTQCEVSELETEARDRSNDCVSSKDRVSLKNTAEGIMALLQNANPCISGQLINGQGVPMKF